MKTAFSFIITLSISFSAFAYADFYPAYKLANEPIVRIGMIRSASSIVVSTRSGTLSGSELGASETDLGTQSVRFSTRPYRIPENSIYRFSIPDIETKEEADDLAAQIQTETNEAVSVKSGEDNETWLVSFEKEMDSKEAADAFTALITEKGFQGIRTAVENYTSPSDDAIILSRQISLNPKSQVRSISTAVAKPAPRPDKPTVISTLPVRKNMNAAIMSGLREVVGSGSAAASFSSLRAVTVGTTEPGGIVYLNGVRYRGKVEVFVNSKGGLTAVNAVPMEDYLLGVVPAELSLPQIEAQKAQAVAARTYAAANKDGYLEEGFDMLPTVWSQVYKGVAIESAMGSTAVRATRGVVATYQGKPINALYTSTCGGRTENSGNIYEFDEPYLRGVNCSLDGGEHFDPFLIKTSRLPALIRNEANYEFVLMASRFAVNNFLMTSPRFDDEYFEDAPTETELKSWLNQLAVKFNKPFPTIEPDSSRPLKLARILHSIIYSPNSEADADTLMSDSDINYQLAFLDAAEVPKNDRIILAELLRDGWFSIHSDLTIKPGRPYSRSKILSIIDSIYNKKKWSFEFESGTARSTDDGKLMIRKGRGETEIQVDPNAFLFRKFGGSFVQVKEVALIGGETVTYKLSPLGTAVYVAVEPTESTTVAERMSPFTTWSARLSASQVRSRLARYVKGMGDLIDVRIKKQGVSKRAIELEIVTTNGVHLLSGGKIRSALRLREQLFVMDKRFGANGRVLSFEFTGRGWGHGIGMCQYGAYGFAQMGVKFDTILKHFYTGIELTRAY